MSRRCVVLVGMMGAGKTEVGEQLAADLGYDFVDVDQLIVEKAGKSIPKIFKESGQDGFRVLETETIRELDGSLSRVIAPGGGALETPENAQILRTLGHVIYLKASARELYQRIKNDRNRPLLEVENPKGEVATLLTGREPGYRDAADFVIDTEELSVDEVVSKLIDELAKRTIETQY